MKLISREYDEHTGITEEYWYDEAEKRIRIVRLQDVEDQLDFNKQAFNSMGNKGYSDSQGGAHHVARIPFTIIEKWRSEGFDWFKSTDKERRKRLNDPDNRYLLVRPGRL
jgi:hypothetical protein